MMLLTVISFFMFFCLFVCLSLIFNIKKAVELIIYTDDTDELPSSEFLPHVCYHSKLFDTSQRFEAFFGHTHYSFKDVIT